MASVRVSLPTATYHFFFCATSGDLGGFVSAWVFDDHVAYWTALVEEGEQVVTVAEEAIPVPRTSTLELRTSGLWADHICESPDEQWTVGLEAFALRLDDPTDMVGERVPLGYDLEFVGPPEHATVAGEILIGQREIDLDAVGLYGSEPSGVGSGERLGAAVAGLSGLGVLRRELWRDRDGLKWATERSAAP